MHHAAVGATIGWKIEFPSPHASGDRPVLRQRPVGQLPLPLGNAPTVPAARDLRQFWQVGRGRDHWVQHRESRRARSIGRPHQVRCPWLNGDGMWSLSSAPNAWCIGWDSASNQPMPVPYL